MNNLNLKNIFGLVIFSFLVGGCSSSVDLVKNNNTNNNHVDSNNTNNNILNNLSVINNSVGILQDSIFIPTNSSYDFVEEEILPEFNEFGDPYYGEIIENYTKPDFITSENLVEGLQILGIIGENSFLEIKLNGEVIDGVKFPNFKINISDKVIINSKNIISFEFSENTDIDSIFISLTSGLISFNRFSSLDESGSFKFEFEVVEE